MRDKCKTSIRSDFYNAREYDKAYRDADYLIRKDELYAHQVRYRKAHPEKVRATHLAWTRSHKDRVKHYNLAKFGLTLDEYNNVLENQDGLCAICRKTEKENKSLAVDHNHSTGQVRGLLCSNCNRGLGLFQENIERLANAIRYITKNQL